jgi:hypothetical protein
MSQAYGASMSLHAAPQSMMINASVPAHGWSAGMCPSGVSRRNLVIKTANSLERAWIPGITRAAVEHAIDARTLYAIVPQDRGHGRVCRCLSPATVSRQHGSGARLGVIWYTPGHTGLGTLATKIFTRPV